MVIRQFVLVFLILFWVSVGFWAFGDMNYTTTTPVDFATNTTPITSSAWVQVKQNANSKYVQSIEIINETGEPLYFGVTTDSTDPSAAQLIVGRTGSDRFNFTMTPNSDIFMKAVSSTASPGKIQINMFNDPISTGRP